MRSALDHAVEAHSTKLALGSSGLASIAFGVALDELAGIVLGACAVALAAGQIATYWRHDHESCTHPACSGVDEGVTE